MNPKERISTNETQEEIKIPEVKAETPVTIEQIKAQISELQAKLEEIKKTNQDTAQAETARIDDAVKKLGVGNPEETIAAKTEVESIEAEKQEAIYEAEEKIAFMSSEEKPLTPEEEAKNAMVEARTRAQAIEEGLNPDGTYAENSARMKRYREKITEEGLDPTLSYAEKIAIVMKKDQEKTIEDAKKILNVKSYGEHGDRYGEYSEIGAEIRKELGELMKGADNELKDIKDIDIGEVQKLTEKYKQNIEKKTEQDKKFEVRGRAENIMRSLKEKYGEESEPYYFGKLKDLIIEPGVEQLGVTKKWTSFLKDPDNIDFGKVQEMIDRYDFDEKVKKEETIAAKTEVESIEEAENITKEVKTEIADTAEVNESPQNEDLLFEESTSEDEEPPLHEERSLEVLTLENEERELIEFIKSKVGQGYIERIYELKSIKSENEREPSKEQLLPTVENTEMLGIKKEVMELVLKTLPKHFFANVESIRYYDIKHKTQKIHGNKDAVASANQRTREIKLYKNAKNREKKWVLESALFHESGHLNDWKTNKFLTLKERLTLYKTIIGRVESPQCFKSHRVEKIKNDNKEYELDTKATEYYGDIVSQYFINPDSLPKEDKIIVEEIIKKNDPEYDEQNGRMERSSIFLELQK